MNPSIPRLEDIIDEDEEQVVAEEEAEAAVPKLEAAVPELEESVPELEEAIIEESVPQEAVPKKNIQKDIVTKLSAYCEQQGNFPDEKCNKVKLIKESLEYNDLAANPNVNEYLYPTLNDPNFSVKIAEKKEFSDTKYDGRLADVKEYAEVLLNAPFELSPHQAFVRNFLSFQTPYNSLLLYHGLGTGKTCSSIGVCEEMRDYFKQVGINKKIIVVASPNVQDNFRLQLFDERNLKNIDGIWTMRGCIGTKLIKEVNPTNMKGLTKERLVKLVDRLIKSSYKFMGYIQFGNEIERITQVSTEFRTQEEIEKEKIRLIQREYNDSLIVIDEVHNLRITDDNENKDAAKNLLYLVSVTNNLRLLLLSATPMFNTHKEIVWLLNLMNKNDKRGTITERDIFDRNGNLKIGKNGEEVGKDLLIKKSMGYISFVRGENPYIFPFRIYPDEFSPDNTFHNINEYPTFQLNGKIIPEDQKIQKLILFLVKIGEYQKYAYKYIIDKLRKNKLLNLAENKNFEDLEGFGYSDLQIPIEALNIVYPVEGLKELADAIPAIHAVNKTIASKLPELNVEQEGNTEPVNIENIIEEGPSKINPNPSNEETVKIGGEKSSEEEEEEVVEYEEDEEPEYADVSTKYLTGTEGLKHIMKFTDTRTPAFKGNFEYKTDKFGRIFSPGEIGKYSSKIENICKSILLDNGNIAEGIILIYSNYIDGGLIPVALTLEEMGFTRHGGNNLFKENPKNPTVKGLKYTMITGDSRLSRNNDGEVKALTNEDNINGEKIKVVLISQAGAEGLDFKCIRQIHILDPWYNMNHIEQIIGRGVRNMSHRRLPFEKRNVQIFLYASVLENNKEESADLYVYRVAEQKSNKIGEIARILKQNAVDCLINQEQNNFTKEKLEEYQKEPITQELSTGVVIKDYKVGDAPFSAVCDYMNTCDFKCIVDVEEDKLKQNADTYTKNFLILNSDKIIQKIKNLMLQRYFYKKRDLFTYINVPKKYPSVQIYAALTQLIDDPTEFIVDKYGRTGRLINVGEYYLFQPTEITNNSISIYERSMPINYKHNMIKIDVKEDLYKPVIDKTNVRKKKEIDIDVDVDIEEIQAEPIEETVSHISEKGEKIFNGMKENYEIALGVTSTSQNLEDNWYVFCKNIFKQMLDDGYDEEMLVVCLVEHIIESLSYLEKLELLNYINDDWECTNFETDFLSRVKEYFCDKIIQNESKKGIVFFDGPQPKDNLKLIILKGKQWAESTASDIIELKEKMLEKFKKYTNFNEYVGFMGFENKNLYTVFKIKETTKKRHIGTRCDQAGKAKTIKFLNDIDKEKEYTKENTKGIVQPELCVRLEFIMRIYNKENRDNERWFLTPEEAIVNFNTSG